MRKFYLFLFALIISVSGLKAQSYGTVDLGIWFIDNGSSQQQISSITVPYGSDFNTCFAVYNFYMEEFYVNFYDTLHLDAYLDGQLIGNFGTDVQSIPLASGVYFDLQAMPASYIASHNYYGTHTFAYKVSPSSYWNEADWSDNMATITVEFVAPPVQNYTIQVINTDGTVSPSGNVSVSQGASQPFTITAPANRQIDKVYADGVDVTAANNLVFSDPSHATFTFYNVTSDHTFFVTYKTDNGTDAVSDFNFDNVSVMPNPAVHQVTVTAPQAIRLLELYDATGKQVLRMEPHTSEAVLPMAALPTGIYMVKVCTDDQTVVRKLLKK